MLEHVKKAVTTFSYNLHQDDARRFVLWICFGVILGLSLLVRKELIPFTNADYDIFASWYDYVKQHGIISFRDAFSNYNPPYTYFLYLVTLLPVSKLLAIKGLMVLFDILLAASVYVVVQSLRGGKVFAFSVAVASLFLPTVLATGVFWGQFDQLYTAFILFSLAALLKNHSKLAWLMFGVAIAIKLQAIFFLPVLIAMSFKRINWYDAAYAFLAFLVLTFLPMLAGRSLGSILNIYVAQASLFTGNLTLNTPNIYQWVPNTAFEYLNDTGIYFTLALMVVSLIFVIIKKRFSDRDILLTTAIMLLGVPFFLPQMHERYMFTATIACFLLVLLSKKYIWQALCVQLVVLFSYVPFLFNTESPISFPVLSLVNLGVLAYLIWEYIRGFGHSASSSKVLKEETS